MSGSGDSNQRSAKPAAWSLPAALLVTAAGVPLIFWLSFGVLDGYAYGFTGFLLLLELAVHFIPRKTEDLAGGSEASKVKRSRFDFLGVIWLLSIPFAPFMSWILTNAFDVTVSNWRLLYTIRATLCVVVPIVCVLPLLRYVRGRPATFLAAVLLIGTAFPVLTAIQPAIDVIRGPGWEKVNITSLRNLAFRTVATTVRKSDVFVGLSDGRTLTHSDRVDVHYGAMEVLVLRASRYILDAR